MEAVFMTGAGWAALAAFALALCAAAKRGDERRDEVIDRALADTPAGARRGRRFQRARPVEREPVRR